MRTVPDGFSGSLPQSQGSRREGGRKARDGESRRTLAAALWLGDRATWHRVRRPQKLAKAGNGLWPEPALGPPFSVQRDPRWTPCPQTVRGGWSGVEPGRWPREEDTVLLEVTPPSRPGVPRFHSDRPLIRGAARVAGRAPRPSGVLTLTRHGETRCPHALAQQPIPSSPESGPLDGADTQAWTGQAAPRQQSRGSCPGSLPPSLSPTSPRGPTERSLPSSVPPRPPTLPGPLPHVLLTLLGHQAQPRGRHGGPLGSVPGGPSPCQRQVDPGRGV